MDILSFFLIGLGLSMDAFAVSVSSGVTQKGATFRHALITALFFGLFQGFMPFLGWALGIGFSEKIRSVNHWIAFGLLAFIGIRMIVSAVKKGQKINLYYTRFHLKTLVVLALATSIDALTAGVGFAAAGAEAFTNILSGCGIIAATTAAVCTAGFYLGRFCGMLWKQKAEIAGGVILIAMGGKILAEHLLSAV